MKRMIWETIYLASKERALFIYEMAPRYSESWETGQSYTPTPRRYLQGHFGYRFCRAKRLCFMVRNAEVLSAGLFHRQI